MEKINQINRKTLKKLIKTELISTLYNPGTWIALGVGIFLCVWQYINVPLRNSAYLDAYEKEWPSMLVPHSVFNQWIGAEMYSFQYYAFFMLIPLLAALPAGNRISTDVKSGYIISLIVRGGRMNYYIAKIVSAFLSGGIVVLIPLVLNLLLTAMTLPSITPNHAVGSYSIRNGFFCAGIFYSSPYLYILIFFLIIFVISGLMSAFGVSLGFFGIKPFINIIYPFLVSLTLYTVLGEFGIYSFIPFFYLNPSQVYPFNGIAVLLEALLLIAIILIQFFREKKIDVY